MAVWLLSSLKEAGYSHRIVTDLNRGIVDAACQRQAWYDAENSPCDFGHRDVAFTTTGAVPG